MSNVYDKVKVLCGYHLTGELSAEAPPRLPSTDENRQQEGAKNVTTEKQGEPVIIKFSCKL